MSKRIISFLLAATMVMSLFGFSLSVYANPIVEANYLGEGRGIQFRAVNLDPAYAYALVSVTRISPDVPVVDHMFPIVDGEVSGIIYAGRLSDVGNYRLSIWPGGVDAPRIEPHVTDVTVTFGHTGNGSVTATAPAPVGTVASGALVPAGTDVTFVVTPDYGWALTNLVVTGGASESVVGTGVTFTRAANTDLDVRATFTLIPDTTTTITLLPTQVTFDRLGEERVLTVRNSGNTNDTGPLTVSLGGANPGAFLIHLDDRTIANLAPGETRSIRVVANAQVSDRQQATLTVSGPNVPQSVSSTLIFEADEEWWGGRPRPTPPGGFLPYMGLPTPTPAPVATPTPELAPRPGEPYWDWDGMIPASVLFSDIPMAQWFHDTVTVVYHYSLMHGIVAPVVSQGMVAQQGVFEPQRAITRAEVIQVIANLAGANLANYRTGTPAFSDSNPADWHFPAVQWAQAHGITTGVGDGRFGSQDPITRESMVGLINNFASQRNVPLPASTAATFTDQANVSDWAVNAVAAVSAAGIISGFPDGSFQPRETATRAEVASIFRHFMQVTDFRPPSR